MLVYLHRFVFDAVMAPFVITYIFMEIIWWVICTSGLEKCGVKFLVTCNML